ncbi:MAG: AMP-binding protein, partial [Thermodesulfobacteriota bacterium]|nr:AMP-binding protein [Thermodesulfobacteriota bacterium]
MEEIYRKKPWIKLYPSEVPAEVEIPSKLITEAFDEATDKWKKKTALIFYGNKIRYGELRESVDRFANALFHLGVKKGDRVSMLMLNSPEYIIAFYGILKVGGIAVSISPVYVSSEIKHQLQNSESETIICQDMLYGTVEKTGVKQKNVILTSIADSLPKVKKLIGKSILRGVYQKMAVPSPMIYEKEGFHRLKDLIDKYPPNPPNVEINSEDVITLQYTGGTTGLPKGVMMNHKNMIANLTQYHTFYSFFEEGKEVYMAYMPFYHAGGQFVGPVYGLCYGHTLIVITTPEPDEIINSINRYKVTHFFGAPSLYEILKDYEKTDRVRWRQLKICISTADALNEATAEDWNDRTGVVLHDFWAATETGFTLANPLGKQKPGSVGIPVCNTLAAILDPEKDEFYPPGEIGELVISGPQTTTGYWRNPDATKECESIIKNTRWWRTGDLARMEAD